MRAPILLNCAVIVFLSTWIPTVFGILADVPRVSITPALDPEEVRSLSLHSIHGRHVRGRPKATKVGHHHHRIGTGQIKAEYESFDDFIKRQSMLKQSNDVFSHGQEEKLIKTNNESESVEETSKRTRHQRVAPKYPKKFYSYDKFSELKKKAYWKSKKFFFK